MTKNITKFLFLIAIISIGAGQIQSQEIEVFWGNEPGQGDFSNGLNGWTTINELPMNREDVVWEVAPDGKPLVNEFFGGNHVFSSAPTASNGVATFSFLKLALRDGIQDPYTKYSASLISPIIDCSGKEYVTLEYYQAYNRLNEYSQIGFSIDGGKNWRLVQTPYDGIVNGKVDDRRVRIEIPEFANQKECRIKFVSYGDFYYWSIDDVSLRAGKEIDVKVNTDWYSSAPNPQVPSNLVTEIPFYLDVMNKGNFQAEGVSVEVSVLKGEKTLHTQTMDYGIVGAGDTIANRSFEKTFTPPSEEGKYTIRYTVKAANENSDTLNNIAESTFHVGGKVISKTPKGASVRPIGLINKKYGANFSYGNYYSFPTDKWSNGRSIILDKAQIAIFSRDTTSVTGAVTVNAYKWINSEADTTMVPNHDELKGKIVATGKVFVTKENQGKRIDVELFDYNDEEAKYVYEKGDETGLLLIAHSSNFNKNSSFAYGGGYYLESNALANSDALAIKGIKNYTTFGAVRDSKYTDGEEQDIKYERWPYSWFIPLTLKEKIPSSVVNTDIKFNMYPNPAVNKLKIDLPTAVQAEGKAIIKVYDMSGRKVISRQYDAKETINVNISHLSAGTYTIKLESKEGYNTSVFVVAK